MKPAFSVIFLTTLIGAGQGLFLALFAADRFNPGVLKFCAWLGPTFTAMWLIGAAPIGDFVFVPPPSASDGATETFVYLKLRKQLYDWGTR